jgi:hypothetical protein
VVLEVTDLGATVDEATRPGATEDPFQPQQHARVMCDPAGHLCDSGASHDLKRDL